MLTPTLSRALRGKVARTVTTVGKRDTCIPRQRVTSDGPNVCTTAIGVFYPQRRCGDSGHSDGTGKCTGFQTWNNASGQRSARCSRQQNAWSTPDPNSRFAVTKDFHFAGSGEGSGGY